jgi:hypothetical protein
METMDSARQAAAEEMDRRKVEVLGKEGVAKALESTAKAVKDIAGSDFEVKEAPSPRDRRKRYTSAQSPESVN